MNPLAGRVAYVTGHYPRASHTFIQREIAGLRALGFEVLTASIRRTEAAHVLGPAQEAEQAATFHVLEATARPGRFLRALGQGVRRPGRFLRSLRLAWRTAPKGLKGRLYNLFYFAEALTLAAWMRDNGVVHLHDHFGMASGTVAMLASDLTGTPYSLTIHGPDILFAADHWQLGEKVARAAFTACISDFCRAQAMFFSGPAHWDRIHVIHCGVEPERYDHQPAPEGRRILFVGRLVAVKGLRVLFEALEILRRDRPDVTLTLVGDGEDRAALEAAARSPALAGAVRFLGYRDESGVAGELQRHDILALPSFAEGVPVVLMEAMAARLPVVVSQVAGVAELIRHGESGYLVPAGNPDELARAIRHALDAPPAMGQAGRATVVSDFDSRAEAARLATLIVAAAQGGPRPPRRPGPLS